MFLLSFSRPLVIFDHCTYRRKFYNRSAFVRLRFFFLLGHPRGFSEIFRESHSLRKVAANFEQNAKRRFCFYCCFLRTHFSVLFLDRLISKRFVRFVLSSFILRQVLSSKIFEKLISLGTMARAAMSTSWAWFRVRFLSLCLCQLITLRGVDL